MAPQCKNLCARYSTIKPRNGTPYQEHVKYCKLCSQYVKWEGVRCPCCSMHMRVTPRQKQKLNYPRVRVN